MIPLYRKIVLVVCFVLLVWGSWLLSIKKQSAETNSASLISDTLAPDNYKGFKRVTGARVFKFPDDHGSHDQYQTEWWYFTGNVKTLEGRKFGYELTFFRFALAPGDDAVEKLSAWHSRQLYMAHFALTDVMAAKFYADERFSRAALGLAGAQQDHLEVWLYDWFAKSKSEAGFPMHLHAVNDLMSIDLTLDEIKPFVLQGKKGLSQKSSAVGNASYYYSNTRMATRGTLSIAQQPFPVAGESWMDHEWSTSSLSKAQLGWDWFALQLSDHSELMFYQFRRKDGKPDSNSSGALFTAGGRKIPLPFNAVQIRVDKHWKSPHSAVNYPAQWHLSVPGQQLELDIMPLLADQELNLRYRYWEGAVKVSGLKQGQAVSGQGYVELTGYATGIQRD